MCYLLFYYLKKFLTNDSFKNTSTQWFLLIQNICCNKKFIVSTDAIIKQFIVSTGCHKYLPKTVTKRCPSNKLKLGNIETLYLLRALKKPVQIDYNKACYVI